MRYFGNKLTKTNMPMIRIITDLTLIKFKHSATACHFSYISHSTANTAIYRHHLSFLSHPAFFFSNHPWLSLLYHSYSTFIPFLFGLLSTHGIHTFSLQHLNIFLYCLISCIRFSFPCLPPPSGTSANHLLIMFCNNQISHLASGQVPIALKAKRELLPKLTLLQHHLPGPASITGPWGEELGYMWVLLLEGFPSFALPTLYLTHMQFSFSSIKQLGCVCTANSLEECSSLFNI